MLANYHTHTNFCDGKNSAEEIVLCALDKGFGAIGFSGHGYTPFDLSYCIQNMEAYIAEITRLKVKYKDKIQIYCGVEEDACFLQERTKYDYILGSLHYVTVDGKPYTIDSDVQRFETCLSVCGGDPLCLAENYYTAFVDYIIKRKPDIVGHFDLITKFDERENPMFFGNRAYEKMAERFIEKAATSGCVFEVNTGAISRGYRTTPYPAVHLLYALKKMDGKVILSSDCHDAEKLDYRFEETKMLLRDVGFSCVYEFVDGTFVKRNL